MNIKTFIQLCGIAHILLGLGSLLIPKMLNWKAAFSDMPLLIKQMFLTYAGYILFINIFFGITSILLVDEMLSGSGLALSFTLLIGLYWISRLLIQFLYFDKSEIPRSFIYLSGEWILITLFILFSLIYSYAFYINYTLWMH